MYVMDEPIGLKILSKGRRAKPTIIVRIFTKKRQTKQFKKLVKDIISSKLSIAEDLNEFYSLAKKDTILKTTVKDLYGMHSTEDANLFSIALLAITLQMAPLKRSEAMLESIIRTYGTAVEFDGKKVLLLPRPKTMAKIKPSELKARCNVGYRAKYIVQLAMVIIAGFPALEELRNLPADESKKKIMSLPGVGDYSSDIINPNGGFPIDVWSADVFGKLFYGHEPKNGRDEIDRIKNEGIKRWGKWSWYAFFYVVNDLENLSKKLGISLRLQ